MKRFYFLVTLISFALFSSSVSQAELIAHYQFDGGTSDSTGNGNDGVAEGDAAYAGDGSGIVGGAYQFEGAGHVNIPINFNPSVQPDMTVTMWVKPDQSAIDSPSLYKTFGHDDGGWDRTFGLDNRQGEYRYAAFTGGRAPGPTATTGEPISNDWTFIAAVWDTDGEVTGLGETSVQFFANESTILQALNNTPSIHTNATIGSLRPDNFAEGWRGLIDDVRVYDTALTGAEVNAIRLAVPEPSSALLLIAGVLCLLNVRRR